MCVGGVQLQYFSDALISKTVTLAWCDEWYDLLMLTYSMGLWKMPPDQTNRCVRKHKLLNITVPAMSSTLCSGWKELWKQGRVTGAHVSARKTHKCAQRLQSCVFIPSLGFLGSTTGRTVLAEGQ